MPPDMAAQLVDCLDRVEPMMARFDMAVARPPATGSAAAVEEPDELGHYAYHLAACDLRVALDNLNTWRLLLSAGWRPAFAHLSMIRTAHETALHARWLMDPTATPDERLARGVAAAFADLEERRKAEAAASRRPVAPAKSAAERQTDLIREARRRGLTKPDKHGKHIPASPAASMVDLFDLYELVDAPGKGSLVYRYLSGLAHGKQWAIMLGARRATPSDANGHALALASVTDEHTLATTSRAVAATSNSVNAYLALRQN